MQRGIATVGALVLGLVTLYPGAAPGAAPRAAGHAGQRLSAADQASIAAGLPVAVKARAGVRPAGPNPYLAMVPDAAKADFSGWSAYLQKQAAHRPEQATAAVLVDEDEPDGSRGSNEDPGSAQPIKDFGTGTGQHPALRVLGALNPEHVEAEARPATREDDGSIPLAGDTGITALRKAVVTDAKIGDGPHGSKGKKTNDFDFYRVRATAGQILTVATDTPTGKLDTVVVLYKADGTIVAANDDAAVDLDSLLWYKVPEAGTYYAMVAGYAGIPADPFDPASGDGGASEGPYSVTISATEGDTDFYAVRLAAGDVLGASVEGAAQYITIYDSSRREVHGSAQNATLVYPGASPLPGGGNAVTDYVATEAGTYYVGVTQGEGSYDLSVEAYKPAPQGEQTLFLDFDGGRVNTGLFWGRGNVALSPFSAFLAKWGIPRDKEDAVIDAVIAGFTENVERDLAASGLNGKFKLKILNSVDNPDPWGRPNVSRIVVGGTMTESGVWTIGIAQSIDPGNFETEETALVLLDVLSGPAGEPASLNTYLRRESDRIAFVGRAVGNVTAHEAGHFFGNWHTDNEDETANLMDAGGTNFDVLFGVGPDKVGGTGDDPDVDFGEGRFSPAEGFVGTEDTLGRIVFGLTG